MLCVNSGVKQVPAPSPRGAAALPTPRALWRGWSSPSLGPCRSGCKRVVPRQRVSVESAAAGRVDVAGRELTAAEDETWQASSDILSSTLGFSPEEADRVLARAFGWSTQAFWRREKVEELPTADQVLDALDFLRDELLLDLEDQLKIVKAFPEVLACDVDKRLRANVAQLQSQWRLQGSVLTKAVLRQPQLLGYSVDCGGDCIGECNRCWVRF